MFKHDFVFPRSKVPILPFRHPFAPPLPAVDEAVVNVHEESPGEKVDEVSVPEPPETDQGQDGVEVEGTADAVQKVLVLLGSVHKGLEEHNTQWRSPMQMFLHTRVCVLPVGLVTVWVFCPSRWVSSSTLPNREVEWEVSDDELRWQRSDVSKRPDDVGRAKRRKNSADFANLCK